MNKLWSDRAWDDYLYWQMQDKKTLKRINQIIKDIEGNGLSDGIGEPELLKRREAWSRNYCCRKCNGKAEPKYNL